MATTIARRDLLKMAVAAGAVGLAGAATHADPSPRRVVLCTDLFHPPGDPDDHFDLACLYAMRGVDVVAVILDRAPEQAERPGEVAVSQLNRLTGRSVPTYVGLGSPLKTIDDDGSDNPPAHEAGVEALLSLLATTPSPLAIASVGSLRDVAAGLNRAPALFHRTVHTLLVFAGEATLPGFQETNVAVDPHAYVRVMTSGLNVRWVPCFDGGLWSNNGSASFVQVQQSRLFPPEMPAPLVRWFSYMLSGSSAPPMKFLAEPPDEHDRRLLATGMRNLWAGPLLELLWSEYLTYGGRPACWFEPTTVRLADDGTIDRRGMEVPVQRFQIRDVEVLKRMIVASTRRLLADPPLDGDRASQSAPRAVIHRVS